MGVAVDADIGRDNLSGGFVHKVNDFSEVACRAQVLLILVGELVSVVSVVFLVEIGILADKMGHEVDFALLIGLERQACVHLLNLAAHIGGDGDKRRFAVEQHFAQVARLFKLFFVNAPAFFQLRPVNLAFVNGLVLLGFADLIGRLCLAVFKHRLVRFGVFEHFAHYRRLFFVVVSINLEKAEHRRILALAQEIRHEGFQRILPDVEFHKVGELGRFYIGHLGCAVIVHAGHCTDFPAFVVTGNQHLIFFLGLVLFHRNKEFCCLTLHRQAVRLFWRMCVV